MIRSMKAVLAGVFIVCLFVFSVQAAPPLPSASQSAPVQTAPAQKVTPQPVKKPEKPDLVVELNLVTEKYTDPNAGGITCYNVTPRYTITNIGQKVAAGFLTKMECKPAPGVGWQVWAMHPNRTLNPGQSFTIEPTPTARTKWCEGYGNKAVGFRITADDGDIIKESNEGNNTAEKLFP